MPKTAVKERVYAITHLLGTEGFTDHCAHWVQRFWKHHRTEHRRQIMKHEELEQEMARVCKPLSMSDRLIIGKFVNMKSKMTFESGLRIGLAYFAHTVTKDGVQTVTVPGIGEIEMPLHDKLPTKEKP